MLPGRRCPFQIGNARGVSPRSSWDEIRRAYRRAAFAAHPDRGGSTRKMQVLNAAFERLKAKHER